MDRSGGPSRPERSAAPTFRRSSSLKLRRNVRSSATERTQPSDFRLSIRLKRGRGNRYGVRKRFRQSAHIHDKRLHGENDAHADSADRVASRLDHSNTTAPFQEQIGRVPESGVLPGSNRPECPLHLWWRYIKGRRSQLVAMHISAREWSWRDIRTPERRR